MLRLFLKFSVGSLLAAAISLFSTPVITALIVPQEAGKASMFTLAFNLVLQIILLGTDQSFVRKFYADDSPAYRRTLLASCAGIPLLLAFIIAGAQLLFYKKLSLMLTGEASLHLVVLLGATLIVGVFERYAMLLLRMNQSAMKFSMLRLAFAVLNFLGTLFYCYSFDRSFFAIIYGNLIGLAVTAGLGLLFTRNIWSSFRIDKKLLKEIFRYGLPFLPTFLIGWFFEGIDKMMLRRYTNFEEIGLFSAAFKFVAILSILQMAFSNFWIPVSMEMYEKNSETARETFSRVFNLIAGVLFIGGLSIVLFRDLIMLLFDEQYKDTGFVMPFLLFIPIMYTLSEVTVGGINYSNKTYYHLFIALFTAGLNYGLNFWLVPEYGARGAAIATGISYVALFYARTLVSSHFYPLKISHTKILLSVAIVVAIFTLNAFNISPYLDKPLALAAIGVLLLLYWKDFSPYMKKLALKRS